MPYAPVKIARHIIAALFLAAGAAVAAPPDVAALVRAGQAPQALEQINRYLAGNPRDAQGLFSKGFVLMEMGRNAEAITVYQRLADEYPALAEPHNNLAVLYVQSGQPEKARQALELAIKANPAYLPAYENLGDVYVQLAGRTYDKVAKVDPGNTEVRIKSSLAGDLLKPDQRRAALAATEKLAAEKAKAEERAARGEAEIQKLRESLAGAEKAKNEAAAKSQAVQASEKRIAELTAQLKEALAEREKDRALAEKMAEKAASAIESLAAKTREAEDAQAELKAAREARMAGDLKVKSLSSQLQAVEAGQKESDGLKGELAAAREALAVSDRRLNEALARAESARQATDAMKTKLRELAEGARGVDVSDVRPPEGVRNGFMVGLQQPIIEASTATGGGGAMKIAAPAGAGNPAPKEGAPAVQSQDPRAEIEGFVTGCISALTAHDMERYLECYSAKKVGPKVVEGIRKRMEATNTILAAAHNLQIDVTGRGQATVRFERHSRYDARSAVVAVVQKIIKAQGKWSVVQEDVSSLPGAKVVLGG